MQIDVTKSRHLLRKFEAGSLIAREGGSGTEVFVLVKGSVRSYKNYKKTGEAPLFDFGPGDFLGELGLFLNLPWPHTLVAQEETIALCLTRNTIYEFFQTQPEGTFALIGELCARIRDPRRQAGQPVATDSEAQGPLRLFPQGHQQYARALETEPGYLMEKSFTCPICNEAFRTTVVRASRLVPLKTDPDLRVRYEGVEPMHYEVITCPACWYSATLDLFDEGAPMKDQLNLAMRTARMQAPTFQPAAPRDLDAVFTGFYLCLLCAPICFTKTEMMTAKLWLKLSRLYRDCGDDAMYLHAAQQALNHYKTTYERTEVAPKQYQQLCIMIGELSFQLGHIRDARNFFFKAKTDPAGAPALKRHADDRIEAIREALSGNSPLNLDVEEELLD